MPKTIFFFLFIFLLAGCTSNYYLSGKKELDDSEKKIRNKELEQVVVKIKTGDAITILLYNGDILDGTFYSYVDGILSLRIDDSFRDNELTDIRSITFKPQNRMKKVMMIMIFVVVAGIVTLFVTTH